MKNTETLLLRLKKIDWRSRGEANKGDEEKIYNFLRKAAHIISAHAKQQGTHPFSNFRNAITPSPHPINTLEVEETVTIENGAGAYEKVLCVNAFHWANGCDEGDEVCLSNSDLYEPIISLIEKRVIFTLHHGSLSIGKSLFPLRHWLTDYYTTQNL